MTTPIDLSLAHSPDSDDLVMWWPLTGAGGEPDGPVIDTGRFRFQTTGEDVEQLNRIAIEEARYDATAISCSTYAHCKDRYRITASGGSFGEGYGPKIVVREDSAIREVGALRGSGLRVGVPGTRTTAFLSLSLMLGSFPHEVMLFSDIPGAVASGEVDAGLLIHEAQLTYAELGLREVGDVGAWWLGESGMPLPLGLNVIKRDLDQRFGAGTTTDVSRVLGVSIRHAVDHPEDSRRFLRSRAGTRTEWHDPVLVDRYLAMYVSDRTLDMGELGQRAIRRLLGAGHAAGLCPDPGQIDVV